MSNIKTLVNNDKNAEIIEEKFTEINNILKELEEKYGVGSIFGMYDHKSGGSYKTSNHGNIASILVMLTSIKVRVNNTILISEERYD